MTKLCKKSSIIITDKIELTCPDNFAVALKISSNPPSKVKKKMLPLCYLRKKYKGVYYGKDTHSRNKPYDSVLNFFICFNISTNCSYDEIRNKIKQANRKSG